MPSLARALLCLSVIALVTLAPCSAQTLPGQAFYENATTELLNQIQGFIDAYETAITENSYSQDPFGVFDSPAAATARGTYEQASSWSLTYIYQLQRQGIAHYNPQYLGGAHTLFQSVRSGLGLDDPYQWAVLYMPYINHYGNLYNAGTFNWYRWIQQSRIGQATLGFMTAHPKAFKQNANVKVGTGSLVRQDFSDCDNGNVDDNNPDLVGGSVVVAVQNSLAAVTVTLTSAKAGTTYHFFWKCHEALGDIATDGNGKAKKTFNLPGSVTGTSFSFDMYPEGAPSGNKYQSVRIVLD